MQNFEDLGIGKGILQVLKELNFSEPTEIQEKSIPLVVKGEDVIGQAATGSGKTLAFGSGIIQRAVSGRGIQALVLVPTRELAEQVAKSLKLFSKYHELKVLEIYGGVSLGPQASNLRKAEIVVGTPGRILDHLERGTLTLERIHTLVLDEADRMVDMGFLPDVERIISATPKNRQTLLFSATITPDVDRIAGKHMKNPKYVTVKSYVDPSKLKQVYYDVESNEKFSLLVHLLKNDESHLVMVFCNTRGNVDALERNLRFFGFKVMAIHGGHSQNKRNQVMESFHAQHGKILICTDVAARGLDIKNVSHVYNYDIPKNSNEYIHRIGRTARAGKDGEAISLVTNYDYESFRRVLDDSSLNISHAELPEFERLKANFSREKRRDFKFGNRRGGFRGGSRGGRSFGRGGGRSGGRFGSRRGGDGRSDGNRRDGGSRSGGRSFGGRRSRY